MDILADWLISQNPGTRTLIWSEGNPLPAGLILEFLKRGFSIERMEDFPLFVELQPYLGSGYGEGEGDGDGFFWFEGEGEGKGISPGEGGDDLEFEVWFSGVNTDPGSGWGDGSGDGSFSLYPSFEGWNLSPTNWAFRNLENRGKGFPFFLE